GPVLWSFGGMEVDKDGKTVKINSDGTAQTIEWYKKMFKDCMEPEVLSWSDASNNESIQQGKAGWIHNPVSAYIIAKQRKLITDAYILPNMIAKAVTGTSTKDAIAWAETEMKKIMAG